MRSTLFALALLHAALATAVGPAGIDGCARRDTLMVMPLATDADLDAWRATAETYRGPLRNATAEELHRYRDAAMRLRRHRETSAATRALIRHYRIYEVKGTKYLRLADELSILLPALPEEERGAAHSEIGHAKSAAGFDVEALRHRTEALRLAHPDSVLARLTRLGNLATSYARAGDTTAALTAIHRTVDLTASLPDPAERIYNSAFDFHLLGRLFRARGDVDSARHYYTAAIAAGQAFPAGDRERAHELSVVGRDATAELAILSGDTAAALGAIDSLRAYSSRQALLHEVRVRRLNGDYARAYDLLAGATFRTDRRREEALRQLIELADHMDRPRAAQRHALELADFQTERARRAQVGLSDMSRNYLAAFGREREALARQHAGEMALVRSRQRSVLLLAAVLASLGFAVWAYRRARRSSERSAALSNLVVRRDEDLRVANAALERQLKELQEFNHLLSHDLREPLRSISGFSKLLGRRVGADSPLAPNLSYLRAGVDQLVYLHEGVERLRKIKTRKHYAEDVDVVGLVERLVAYGRTRNPADGVTVDAPPGPLEVVTDPSALHTIVRELLDNATKFHGAGEEARVRVSVAGGAREVRLAVEDEGIGIPEEYRERVFAVFQRLNRREDYSGAGIGLAVARAAAERIGAILSIVDTPTGRGVRFELRLPRAYTPPPEPEIVVAGAVAEV